MTTAYIVLAAILAVCSAAMVWGLWEIEVYLVRAAGRLLWRFCCHMLTESEREPMTAPELLRHPAVKGAMAGTVPADGQPLSAEEERILGRIEMDALIGIPEPTDGSDR